MKRIAIFTLFTLAFNFNISYLTANDDFSGLFDMEIFSLSKRKENAFDAPSATYMVTSDDIRRSGLTSIPEILRLVPGLEVARMDNHKWAITSRGFNEQFSNKLLVLIDGRTIYTPLFSGVFWDNQDYILDDIDKIEIVRGTGGTVWGANAVNGVINIITKNAAATQGGHASLSAGNYDRFIAEARHGSKTEAGNSYRVYAKQVRKESFDQVSSNDTVDDESVSTRSGFRYDAVLDNSSVSVHGDFHKSLAEGYFSAIGYDKESRGGNIVVDVDKNISDKSDVIFKVYFDYDQFDTEILRRSARTFDVDFQHFYNFNDKHQFIWGLNYRNIDDEIKEKPDVPTFGGLIPLDYTPNNSNNFIYGAFLQDKINIIDGKLYLIVGSKFEYNGYTDFELQPNARVSFYPSRNQTVWASISQAVRTPTRGEMELVIAAPSQTGHSGFVSEDVTSYELGYRVKNDKVKFDINGFYNQYENLITFDLNTQGLSANGSDPAPDTIFQNLGYGESYGVELVSDFRLSPDLRVELAYSFIKSTLHLEDNSTDTSLVNFEKSPQNQFKLKAYYNVTSKVEFDNFLYYVDHAVTPGGEDVDSYVRYDSRLGYIYSDNVEFSLVLQNITDRRHKEFEAGLAALSSEVGRTVVFKTSIDF